MDKRCAMYQLQQEGVLGSQQGREGGIQLFLSFIQVKDWQWNWPKKQLTFWEWNDNKNNNIFSRKKCDWRGVSNKISLQVHLTTILKPTIRSGGGCGLHGEGRRVRVAHECGEELPWRVWWKSWASQVCCYYMPIGSHEIRSKSLTPI